MIDNKRKVIVVTDGDTIAQKAIERAASNIGGRCISMSAGNPTPLSGKEIIELIKKAKHDPIIVMVDDKGDTNKGKGEKVLEELFKDESIELLGVVAVASNTENVKGVEVDLSITSEGKIVYNAVDKEGHETDSKILYGDTVDVLRNLDVPIIVGIGDPGKMGYKDNCIIESPILTKALELIINNSKKMRPKI